MRQSASRLKINRHRQITATHKNPTKLLTPSDICLSNKSVNKHPSSRPISKNSKISSQHCRRPSIDFNVPKTYEFSPLNNISILKSIFKGTLNVDEQKNVIEEKIKNSSLFKKLLLQYNNLKKDYNNQIQSLKNDIRQLDQQMDTQKQALLSLMKKKQKMERDVGTHGEELIQLQQRNYERYWDVAARLNHQNEQYQDLIQLQDVSRGLVHEDLQKFVREHEHKKNSRPTKQQLDTQVQNLEACCICCYQMQDNQMVCSLPCGHSHHSHCIRGWLSVNKACPLCRSQIQV